MSKGQTRPIPFHMVLRETTQVYEYEKLVASEVFPILDRYIPLVSKSLQRACTDYCYEVKGSIKCWMSFCYLCSAFVSLTWPYKYIALSILSSTGPYSILSSI